MEGAISVARRSACRILTPSRSRPNHLHALYIVPIIDSSPSRAPRPQARLEKASTASRRSRMNGYANHTMLFSSRKDDSEDMPIELELYCGVYQRHLMRQQISDQAAFPTTTTRDSYYTFHSFSNGSCFEQKHSLRPEQQTVLDWKTLPAEFRDTFKTPEEIARTEIYNSKNTTAEPTLDLDQLSPELRAVFGTSPSGNAVAQAESILGSDSEPASPTSPSKKFLKRQQRIAQNKEIRKASRERHKLAEIEETPGSHLAHPAMASNAPTEGAPTSAPAQHKPLVVGRTKPRSATPSSTDNATKPETKATLNQDTDENRKVDSAAAPPADEAAAPKKKEKAPKQPKPPKAAPPSAPLSPALIDLRVGHILRAINHPNADSLYVSTIAMGDPEGTEHTSVDEKTGKVVRTVCSGLNGLVPLAEMQDRKVVVVANLKPVNMRSIKSAAMVLAASPAMEEGADPHAPDRVVELVNPPEGTEAGDMAYFEGWEYGEAKGPEKQLNPKKKQWEAIQPGFYTSDKLTVGFDAGKSEVEGDTKGELVVKGKGACTVKSLKGAVVR